MSQQNKHSTFYAAFEERHRGPRELVLSRLEAYRPFIEPLTGLYKNPRAIDLGCGRGEWLELVSQLGYQAVGVDLDDGMLESCRKLSLNAQKEDALQFLKAQKDNSCVVVSAFHLIEHVQFDVLQELVEQSLRVLKPGGLLIMETPNPENLIVAGVNFYLDPTHQKPIPPDLLSFIPEHYGFERVKILRLQHDPNLADRKDPSLLDVLGG
ncbi:MAG: class I SAM-dependent methyltransferase, partial [Xanthomonadales bacterium]|nr:class I SAM-dependent methyltransferase [Xanthomonadales bacterium]